ncbi:predicted protein, partial [Postia placenta Mad-698-R]
RNILRMQYFVDLVDAHNDKMSQQAAAVADDLRNTSAASFEELCLLQDVDLVPPAEVNMSLHSSPMGKDIPPAQQRKRASTAESVTAILASTVKRPRMSLGSPDHGADTDDSMSSIPAIGSAPALTPAPSDLNTDSSSTTDTDYASDSDNLSSRPPATDKARLSLEHVAGPVIRPTKP